MLGIVVPAGVRGWCVGGLGGGQQGGGRGWWCLPVFGVGGCVGWWVWAMAAANGGGDGGVDGGANGPVPMARGSRRPREAVVVVAALGERESGALSNSLC